MNVQCVRFRAELETITVSILYRLSLNQKFGAIGLIALLMTAFPSALYVKRSLAEIQGVSSELDGASVTLSLQKAVLAIQRHRDAASSILTDGENAASSKKIAALRSEVAKAIDLVDQGIKASNISSQTTAIWAKDKTVWKALENSIAKSQILPAQSYRQHTDLIADLLKLNTQFLDELGLAFDAEPVTSALVQTALVDAPLLTERLNQIHPMGGAALSEGFMAPANRAKVMGLHQQSTEVFNHIVRSMAKVESANAAVRESPGPKTAELQREVDETLALIMQQLIKPPELTLTIKDYEARMSRTDSTVSAFSQSVQKSLTERLEARLRELRIANYGVFTALFLMTVLAALAAMTFARSIKDLVDERTAQLKEKTKDIVAMLENMPQGVLTVLNNEIIHSEYSSYSEVIFDTQEIAGQNLMVLVFSESNLGSDQFSQVETSIRSCIGQDKMNFEFNSHLLSTELEKTMPDGSTKSLELSWSPICDESETVEKLMLCVRDVTELKRLSKQADAQKRELEVIGEILAISQEKFQEFIESALAFVADNDAIIRRTTDKSAEVIGLLFRNMHTIKGNARTHGLKHMTNVVHETEQAYDELRKDEAKPWEPEGLLEQLTLVRSLVDEYRHINDVTLGRKGPGRRGSVERFLMVDKEDVAQSLALLDSVDSRDTEALHTALTQVGNTLRLIGTQKIAAVLAGITDSLGSLAKELGKEPPKVTIQDDGIFIRNQAIGLLKNVFMHLFRNAMDHGLESAEERLSAGKAAAGHIQLSLALDKTSLTMRLADDGQGLNLERIRKIAQERGLLTDQVMSPEAQAMLIFASGFSTAKAVTEVSGRGVGMDAVKGFLQEVGGDVQIRFRDTAVAASFRAFELVITLPAKFAVKASA